MKSITITCQSDIDNLALANSYHAQELTQKLSLSQEIAHFHPCELEAKIKEHEGENYLDYSRIYLNKDKGIIINKDYNGKFSIFSRFYHSLPYINYEDEARLDLNPPSNFKVLNTKIIQKWIDYVLEIDSKLLELSNKRQKEVKTFLDKAETIGADYNHTRGQDGQSGYIESKNLEFKYQVTDTGYVQQELKIKGCETTLERFAELAKLENNL